ncbi:hypothetical protein Gogos_006276, partial [Gossypium gossypioides]|nr:hypothetical protein [Gossypium gossypioides]
PSLKQNPLPSVNASPSVDRFTPSSSPTVFRGGGRRRHLEKQWPSHRYTPLC